jgi:hypothetical protein
VVSSYNVRVFAIEAAAYGTLVLICAMLRRFLRVRPERQG